jgi:hypothetical protein
VLDFEGVGDGNQVGDYYNGGAGPNYGIRFTSMHGVIGSPFYFPPSPNTTLRISGTEGFLTCAAGFTGLSFQVMSDDYPTNVTVYDGVDGSGNVLANGVADTRQPHCCAWGVWHIFSLPFSGVAKSVGFSGRAPGGYEFALYDDVQMELAPSKPPTHSPTKSPTHAPTMPPTLPPTKAPTATSRPSCKGTSYWVHEPASTVPPRKLVKSSATCLAYPYSIEVRPCLDEARDSILHDASEVSMWLVDASTNRVVHRRTGDVVPPYALFGASPGGGDVLPSPTPLPDGRYYVSSSVGGRVAFTQSCPCPKGKKGGGMGCMMMNKKKQKEIRRP